MGRMPAAPWFWCYSLLLSGIFCRAAIVLPLRYGHISADSSLVRGRELMVEGEARMNLYGHVLTRGYYFTDLSVGTPPQHFHLIVDTGSTVTYVPCSTCTECGKHEDSPFLPSASSSYTAIGCLSDACIQQQFECQQHCMYTRHYAENSTSSGVLAEDVVSFGKTSTLEATRVTFGCETRETGDLYTQKADGILGLGRGPLSIVDQLVSRGVTEDCFSLCYGGMEHGGGSMVLGATRLPKEMKFSSFDPDRTGNSAYYNVVVEELRVGGVALALADGTFDQGYGVVLDSGTTFTYLPKAAFFAFKAAVAAGVKGLQPVNGPDPKYEDVCFSGASQDEAELGKFFPTVDFVFGGGVVYQLDPENYLFRHRKVDGAYCLGFFKNADPGTLLGGILVRNTLVTYDRGNGQVGFLKTNCERLFETLHQLAPEDSSGSSSSAVPPSGQPHGRKDCSGCVAGIAVAMSLATDLPSFLASRDQFLADLATELGVPSSQVRMDKYLRNDATPEGVDLDLMILPGKPAGFMSEAEAQRLKKVLGSRQLAIQDVYGAYNVTNVDLVPLGHARPPSSSAWMWVAAAIAVSALVVAAVVGTLAFLRRRLELSARRYTAFDDLDDEDEETPALDGVRTQL